MTGPGPALDGFVQEAPRSHVVIGPDGEVAPGRYERVAVTVRDRGAGVPQAALADIFRPFYRVADARDRQSGGIGLGLSISQRAVQIHGGTVTAINAPDGGLLVHIVLPLTPTEK